MPLSAPDLIGTITDVCAASCVDGPVRVSWQVANEGEVDAPAGAAVALYVVDAGVEAQVATFVLPGVPAGDALSGEVLELDPAALGDGGFILRVDDGDAVRECDEVDNDDTYTDPVCP